ncbi:DUF1643 domain-containing protein [Sphingomonas panaciterrae]|uniref:DUF1643 domain-containing protein n=1 Tax=Sphingomonas panaciterrae TaxID=1462999 RepID=UPI002FF383BF
MSAPDLGVDLLGDPVLRRSAHFPSAGVRTRLTRDWAPGPRALVIGCNPSTADALGDDPTSLWWNAWFQLFGFGGYDAMNLYPFVTSKPAECRKIVDGIEGGDWAARDALHFINLPALVEAAKAAHQVFVCWGAIAWNPMWIDHVVEEIQTGAEPYPDLWCWGTNADGSPKHPMARGKHRIPRDQRPLLWRAK